ncbi:hypothetical protein VB741_17455 [Leptothoe sp. PORK10 BA2]|nr:hypothetical protein [Leptothoe sp. PORK10 BA2]
MNESLSILQWSGVVLTLISVYLVNQREQIEESVAHLLKRVLPSDPIESIAAETKVSDADVITD